MTRCPSTRQGLRCKRKAGHRARLHGDGEFVWEDDAHPPATVPPADTRAAERADILAWLDGDLSVALDPYTVMLVREAVRAGEHVGAARS